MALRIDKDIRRFSWREHRALGRDLLASGLP